MAGRNLYKKILSHLVRASLDRIHFKESPMTGRERVLAALNHQETPRVPFAWA